MDKEFAAAFAEAGEHVSKIIAGAGLVIGGVLALREIVKRIMPQDSQVRREMAKRVIQMAPTRPQQPPRPRAPVDPPDGAVQSA